MSKNPGSMKNIIRSWSARYSQMVEGLDEAVARMWQRRKWHYIIALSLVVIAWNFPYIWSHTLIAQRPGDSDYFFQLYEAIRKSIIEYGQFPWWNPWVGGGVPLFANPQAGVISLQTPLVLLFGAVIGLKLSVVVYSLISFWGTYVLLKRSIKTSHLVSALLSFCWIANGFFVAHLFDHYTFIYFMLVPLGLHLQLNITEKRYWMYFGSFLGFMALASFHYAFLQSVIIFAAVGVGQLASTLLGKEGNAKGLVKRYVLAGALFAGMAGIRIAYTIQYVFDFPKSYVEPANSIALLLKGLLTPGANANFVKGAYLKGPDGGYSLGEYSAYVGVLLFGAVALIGCILVRKLWLQYKKDSVLRVDRPTLGLVALFVLLMLVVLVAKGGSDGLAPFSIIKMIPGYTNMRVPSRWLIWFGLLSIIIVAFYMGPRVRGRAKAVVAGLVLMAVLELTVTGAWYMRAQFTREAVVFRDPKAEFLQYENYNPTINGEVAIRALQNNTMDRSTVMFEYESTRNNVGELFGYEPLNLTLFDTMGRCGVNKGCGFVDSKNAQVVSWSPNKVVLKRLGAGDVVLNLAPSNYWLVNGQRLKPAARVIEKDKIVISDEANELVLEIRPKGPLEVIRARVRAARSR